MYTLESLKEINRSYNYQHWMNEDDVKKANTWVEFIENTRDDKFPQVGDIIEFTNKHGDYYKNAHIEKVSDKELEICEQPYIPFIGTYNGKFYTSTSGGAWSSVPTNLKLIGKRKKYFGDWGHCGACANGQMIFSAMVNVWEYKEPESLYGDFTTKEFDKFYVSVLEDEKLREQHGNYKYIVTTSGAMSHTAFKTDKQYQAWLKTFNGVEFAGHWENQRIVWTHKQIKERVSLEEYNSIDGIIDTTLENGSKWECKRVYVNNKVITYTTPYEDREKLNYSTPEYLAAYSTL